MVNDIISLECVFSTRFKKAIKSNLRYKPKDMILCACCGNQVKALEYLG